MSNFSRSLVCEAVKDPELNVEELLPIRHLSISNVSIDTQPVYQVIKISGNITVSF